MSEELIRKSEVLKLLHSLGGCGADNDFFKGWDRAIDSAYDKVEDIKPFIKVKKVRHGEWIYNDFDIPHCSECGTEVMPNMISKYCPNCGAKMEEETANE